MTSLGRERRTAVGLVCPQRSPGEGTVQNMSADPSRARLPLLTGRARPFFALICFLHEGGVVNASRTVRLPPAG